ncbi:MAG: hypothetical protein WD876_01365 [Candidatus Pacearchaeota archaeon]
MVKNISRLVNGEGVVKSKKTKVRFYSSSNVIDQSYLIEFRRNVRRAHEEIVAGRIKAYYAVQEARERRALNYQ